MEQRNGGTPGLTGHFRVTPVMVRGHPPMRQILRPATVSPTAGTHLSWEGGAVVESSRRLLEQYLVRTHQPSPAQSRGGRRLLKFLQVVQR